MSRMVYCRVLWVIHFWAIHEIPATVSMWLHLSFSRTTSRIQQKFTFFFIILSLVLSDPNPV